MLEIREKDRDEILIKNRNYMVLTGDNEVFLKNICESLNNYFNKKGKILKDKDKVEVFNYYSKIKESISSKNVIFLDEERLESEFEIGSKSNLYTKLNAYFKENISIEPTLITINSLIEELNIEEGTMKLVENISKYSNKKIELSFLKLTATDFIKKVEIKCDEELDSFERLKLYLGILEEEQENKEKIYIFVFPERNIPPSKLKDVKKFFQLLSEKNKVILTTFSKEFINFRELDSINIYIKNQLCNTLLEEEILKILEENYPLFSNREEIERKLKYVLQHFLFEALSYKKITNLIEYDEDSIFIQDYEMIFLLLFYLKLSNIPYFKNINYNTLSPFSNYIEKNL